MSRILLDRDAEIPEHLRFGAQRTCKGRTVNLSALAGDDPDDAAWLIDFLDGGTDPVETEDGESEGEPVPEDQAEGENPEAEPGDDLGALVDDGGAIRQAFARMPASLMRKQDGVMLPDWQLILANVKGQSKKQLEARCLVAEKRFRDNMTRDAVIREATAGIRGRNATKIRADKHHAIWASWRWLDRPENQQKIADVVRQARAIRPQPPTQKPKVQAPIRTDAIGVLLSKVDARKRIKDRADEIWRKTTGPSIMIDSLGDCKRWGPSFHRLPIVQSKLRTRARTLLTGGK